ncbi:MAG: PorV/PorQ family protein [Rhodothermales bacterium]|nr:PorV/PorQ family protein [Rhodothermales bacterium]
MPAPSLSRSWFRSASVIVALVLGLSVQPLFAQSTGVFSRVGFGARGIGLGNALVADASGNASPYYNPALAPFVRAQELSLSAALLRLDRELQYLQFSTPLKPRAGVAIGLTHAGVSNIDGRDNSGFHTEDLATSEYAFFVAFGLKLSERVSAGMGFQLFRSDIYFGLNPVRTVGIDLGLTALVTDDLRIGLAIDDLLARYTWNSSGAFGANGKTTSDKFPRRIRTGFAYDFMDRKARLLGEFELTLALLEARTPSVELVGGVPTEVVTGEEIRRVSSQGRFGGEYDFIEGFVVRAGFDRIGYNGIAGIAPSAGFSVRQPVGNVTVEGSYALVLEPDAAGALNILTLKLFL